MACATPGGRLSRAAGQHRPAHRLRRTRRRVGPPKLNLAAHRGPLLPPYMGRLTVLKGLHPGRSLSSGLFLIGAVG
jgi:hypothetical protein